MKLCVSGMWIFLCLMCVALNSHGAGSQNAKRAFDEGTAFFEQQMFDDAAAKFREAYDIRPNWKLLYNIGQCEAAARHYGVALELFESYMAAGGDNIDLERTNELIDEMERLRNLVGYLELKMVPPGTDVTVDGLHRGRSPLPGPLAVAAGVSHQVVVKNNEEILFERTLRIHSGQSIAVSLEEKVSLKPELSVPAVPVVEPVVEELPEEVTAVEPPPAVPVETSPERPTTSISVLKYPKRQPIKVIGWVFFNVGAGALIAGAATGVMAWSKKKDLDPQCKDGCPEELAEEKRTMENLGMATDVLLGVGAGVAVSGLVMLIIGRVKEKRADISMYPSIGNGIVGLATIGAF